MDKAHVKFLQKERDRASRALATAQERADAALRTVHLWRTTLNEREERLQQAEAAQTADADANAAEVAPALAVQ